MNDTTKSGATGNAAAQVNAGTAPWPEKYTFALFLTPAELKLHYDNNEDIIGLYEKLHDALSIIDRARYMENPYTSVPYQKGYVDTPFGRFSRPNDPRYPELYNYTQELAKSFEGIEAKIEAQIIAELEEVQAEFRSLAVQLQEGYETARKARDTFNANHALHEQKLDEAYQRRSGIRGAKRPPGWNTDLPLTNEEYAYQKAKRTLSDYDLLIERYNLLKRGFAITSWKDRLEGFLAAVAEEVVTEIATLGLGKVIKAAKLTKYVADAASGVRKMKYVDMLAERVKWATSHPKVKEFVRKLKGDPPEVRKMPGDPKGPSVTKSPEKPTTRPCAACAFGGKAQ